jgi:hypothetical protein
MRRYLGYWVPVGLGLSVVLFVVPEALVPSRQPQRFPFFLGLTLALVLGVVLGFAVAYVLMLVGKYARREIRDKEEAWETRVKRYITLPIGLPDASELAKRVLAQVGARTLQEDKDGRKVSGQVGGRLGQKVCVRLAGESSEYTEATVLSVPARDLLSHGEDDSRRQRRRRNWLFDEDWGRNALNVQRICDGLVELAASKGEGAR